MIERLVAGLIISAIVSVAGWRAKALSGTGAIAALLVGVAIAIGVSWPGLLILGTFFVLSSLLSHIRVQDAVVEKGSRRDHVQVLANGGVAAIVALTALFLDEQVAFAMVAASLAAATADTWATEIGSTSPVPPRMLVSRRVVQRGESGGVTRRGTLAAITGSFLIATVAGLAGGGFALAVIATLGGVAGSLLDSLAGELIQERRYCPSCNLATEARIHRCGTTTVYSGGIRGVTNDVVNLVCTATGAGVGGTMMFF